MSGILSIGGFTKKSTWNTVKNHKGEKLRVYRLNKDKHSTNGIKKAKEAIRKEIGKGRDIEFGIGTNFVAEIKKKPYLVKEGKNLRLIDESQYISLKKQYIMTISSNKDKKTQNLEEKINALSARIDRIEADNLNLQKKLSRYMTMKPVDIPLKNVNGQYTLPDQIPRSATHVLIYLLAQTGGHVSTAAHKPVVSNSLGHKFFFYYYTYAPQNAISYNSENIWVEIGPDRRLKFDGFGAQAYVSITGYK